MASSSSGTTPVPPPIATDGYENRASGATRSLIPSVFGVSPDKVQQLAFEDNVRHSSRILDAQSGQWAPTVCGKRLRVAYPRNRYGLPICGACLNRGSG